MLNFTRIPAPRVTLVDPQTGIVSNEWFRFFNNLYSIIYAAPGNVTPGTYGSATVVPQITVDAFGTITAITDVTIAIDASQIVSGTIASARISGSYTGITGVGTLTAGTWNATAITTPYGGTGLSSYTAGDTLYYASGSALTKLAIGVSTYINTSSGTAPQWTDPTTITIGKATNLVGGAANRIAYQTAADTTDFIVAPTVSNTYLEWSGTAFQWTANPLGTVTSVAALTLGTTGTDLSSTVANPTTTPVITLNVPTASSVNRGALSAADWTTFNSKAPGVTFTTNYIPYGQGTTSLNQSAGLQFDGTNFTTTGSATATGFIPSSATIPTNGMYLPAANSVGFATNSTNAIYIDSSQNVGIGKSPTYPLQVSRSNTTGGLQVANITLEGTQSADNYADFSFTLGNNASRAAVIRAITNGQAAGNGHNLAFLTSANGVAATERMRINSAGNVGIGTVSPVGTLDVASLTPNVTIRNTKSGLWTDGEVVGTLSWYTDDPSGIGAHDVASIEAINTGSQTTPNSNLVFSTAVQNVPKAERMRIHPTGGVSIGNTTDPGATNLSVTGSVGIGTTSPASALFVSANTATGGVPEINLENSQNFEAANYLNYKTELIFRGDKQNRYSSAGAILGPLASIATIYSNPTLTADAQQGAGALTFSTRAATATTSSDTLTERMRIDSAGNTYVEVGTFWQYAPAPTSKAAVATLTAAEVATGILNTTGTTYTVTLPTGTALDSQFSSAPAVNISFDWVVVNTASGTITIAVGASGMTSLGTLTVTTGVSARFRFRRTAANTYVLYRIG